VRACSGGIPFSSVGFACSSPSRRLGLGISWLQGPLFFFPSDGDVPNALDKQFRYLAGVYAGAVTGALWWAIPRIEQRIVAVRIAAGAVFLGGIGRCISMVAVGPPGDPTMIGGLVLELGVVPLLVAWQRRIGRIASGAYEP
jgi:hypothetical protein